VNCSSSNLLSGSTLSPSPPPSLLPFVNKYTLYTYTVYKGGGYGVLGLRQISTCGKIPLQIIIKFLDDDILLYLI
jgi:hypothetical protein